MLIQIYFMLRVYYIILFIKLCIIYTLYDCIKKMLICVIFTGPVQGGPRMPPPHMRFPPPGQLPPGSSGMGPVGPRPLMGLLPPGQQVY